MERKINSLVPEEGLRIAASKGNRLTRVHLDLGQEGVSLSMVGAASAVLAERGNRHVVELTKTKEGISLALVGAASAGAASAD